MSNNLSGFIVYTPLLGRINDFLKLRLYEALQSGDFNGELLLVGVSP